MKDLRSLPGVLNLVRQVAREARGYNLLYANSQKAFVVAALAGRWVRLPVVWHLRDLLTAEHFSPSRRRLVVRLANRWASRVLANSEATAQAFVSSGGDVDKVAVVHNGIDPTPFVEVDQGAVAAVRAELGLEAVPVVGVFSRLAPWKGQHVLLEALAALPGVHALLIGAALFGGEVRYATSLHEQAERQGLSDRVHFLGFRSDIPVLLHGVDVVVHTSTAPEPFGRVVVEGMMAGRPVVATRAGGVTEIITDGRTGMLVPPGDVRALAQAVDRLLTSPEEAQALARAGHKEALERFSLQRMLDDLELHLAEVQRRWSSRARR
jgi:glycosyltransferase involved in cell wall biosynthesis